MFAGALVAACGGGSAEDAQSPEAAEPVAQVESALTIPTYASLGAMAGTMDGAPIVVSNNPESVSREGLLLAMDQMTPADVNTVRRVLNNAIQDSVLCPSGGLREFAFYMHHLNQLGANARYYVFLEPATAGQTVTFNAFGSAITQVDTGPLDPGVSPSYYVSLAAVTGTLPAGVGTAGGSRFINLTNQSMTGPFALVNLGANAGSSVDARIKIRSTNNTCMKVRVVAASAANATVTLANTLGRRAYAWGNVPTTASTVGGAPCTDAASIGWGRPAGTYRFERWTGNFATQTLTVANSVRGWRLLAAPTNREVVDSTGTVQCVPSTNDVSPSSNAQRAPGISYYFTNTSGQTEGRDSDPNSTANYGAEYRLRYPVTNSTGQCVNARLVLTSYPATRLCSEATTALTRHYDGAARVTQNGTLLAPTRLFTRCPAGPTSTTIVSKQLVAGETVTWDVQFFVPGLISIPAGILLASCPCGQTC
jgi:hypothetical protein